MAPEIRAASSLHSVRIIGFSAIIPEIVLHPVVSWKNNNLTPSRVKSATQASACQIREHVAMKEQE